MHDSQTIFALASAAGKSGIAIIRISGDRTTKALEALGCKNIPEPRKATLKKLYRENELIDEAVIIYFPAPNSFTGEDVAELHIHGSQAVVSNIISHLSSLDEIRLAEAGEFSRRAFENGKMDLTKAEAIADLIDAETSMQQKQALRQMGGELEQLYENYRSNMIKILAHIEAYIDFPDEDIPEEIKADIINNSESLKLSLEEHIADKRGEIIRSGVHVVIVGSPNVGKSSLINYLSRRDVAIVSDVAGTTRDIIEVHLDINGYAVIISDTAGLREGSNEIESIGVNLAKKKAAISDLKICMFDATELPKLDKYTKSLIDENSIIVINKIDLLSPTSFELEGITSIPISVTTGEGAEALLNILEEKIKNIVMPSSSPLLTRERHKMHVREAIDYLGRFIHAMNIERDIELCAEDLRVAATSIGRITGKIGIDELFDQIFSSFCIGK